VNLRKDFPGVAMRFRTLTRTLIQLGLAFIPLRTILAEKL